VLQDLGLFESRTALGNVELPLLMAGLRARSCTELARSVIARLALDAVADRFPCELSGGQRVALARAMVAKPALLILDEPTSAMDVRSAEIAFGLLAELKHQGTAIIMSSHRTAECMGVCDPIVEMRNGRIIRNDECRGLAAGAMRSRAVS
jgi:ABC-type methionine transport system ATPase subunit